MRATRYRWAGVAAMAMSLALLAGACGDDDDDSDAGGDSSAAPAPSGPPIQIGFVNNENTPAGSYPEIREGAEAAVDYVNRELGGINGRPLEMESCISNASGESSIACANKFVQSGKVAVTYGLDFGGAGGAPVYAQAGIPVFGGLATDPAQLTAPNGFVFIGAIAGAIPAISRYVAEDLGAKKVAVLANDIPASRQAIDTFTRPVFASFGVTDVNAVFESGTAADYTPALARADEGDPDAIMVFFGGQSCSAIMQGSITLGIPVEKMIYIQNCTATSALEAGGAGAEGIRANSPYLPASSDDPEVATYRNALEEYSPDTGVSVDSQAGFSEIMNLYNIAKKITGDITKESITAAFKAAENEPNFMAHPYTCNGRQAPGLTAICNVNERIVQYRNGEFTDVKGGWIEGISRLGG